MKTTNIKRRSFLKAACGVSALSVLPGTFLNLYKKAVSPIQEASPNFSPDIEWELTALPSEVSILPGRRTRVWKYSGAVKKGRKDALQNLDDNYLGPIFRVKKGEKIRVTFKSELDEITIVHWHGLHVPPEMDGHPQYVIEKGEKYVYEFEVQNRAGTYWFHPHPHQFTGPQVYSGGGMGMMGGMMEMPHPVHIHGLQFRIVERRAPRSFARIFDSLKDGFIDEGWKDSFLLLPRTRVKVLLSFKDYRGMYLYHCHNLEHEDMGMMRNYLIE